MTNPHDVAKFPHFLAQGLVIAPQPCKMRL